MVTNPNIIVKATDQATGVLRGIGSEVDAMKAPQVDAFFERIESGRRDLQANKRT